VREKDFNVGFNAATNEFVDLFNAVTRQGDSFGSAKRGFDCRYGADD